ncbi:hypothetical protein I4F81_006224 [Pyropia yezoensis]|uniref:Uncharacterized protein n=1 Tax=Pyropia yezoensis TaxID=2788 RepID=A0ACC3C0C8_PYRYE|nr:hypothetical protein I4F81_006224 [Neopyropia yezoensis]
MPRSTLRRALIRSLHAGQVRSHPSLTSLQTVGVAYNTMFHDLPTHPLLTMSAHTSTARVLRCYMKSPMRRFFGSKIRRQSSGCISRFSLRINRRSSIRASLSDRSWSASFAASMRASRSSASDARAAAAASPGSIPLFTSEPTLASGPASEASLPEAGGVLDDGDASDVVEPSSPAAVMHTPATAPLHRRRGMASATEE